MYVETLRFHSTHACWQIICIPTGSDAVVCGDMNTETYVGASWVKEN
jgi:hypothetical protein